MNDHVLLKEAVARYKAFLYLIKRNREKANKCFCVPAYDIDLIWHTHQLNPASYCRDMVAIIGKVLEHDDTDSDRTKGGKLNAGFSQTTKLWEETFGMSYWKAGAMHRGSTPSPLTITPVQLNTVAKKAVSSDGFQNTIPLPQKKLVEVIKLPKQSRSFLYSFTVWHKPHDGGYETVLSTHVLLSDSRSCT